MVHLSPGARSAAKVVGCLVLTNRPSSKWPFDLEPQYHPIATSGSLKFNQNKRPKRKRPPHRRRLRRPGRGPGAEEEGALAGARRHFSLWPFDLEPDISSVCYERVRVGTSLAFRKRGNGKGGNWAWETSLDSYLAGGGSGRGAGPGVPVYPGRANERQEGRGDERRRRGMKRGEGRREEGKRGDEEISRRRE